MTQHTKCFLGENHLPEHYKKDEKWHFYNCSEICGFKYRISREAKDRLEKSPTIKHPDEFKGKIFAEVKKALQGGKIVQEVIVEVKDGSIEYELV